MNPVVAFEANIHDEHWRSVFIENTAPGTFEIEAGADLIPRAFQPARQQIGDLPVVVDNERGFHRVLKSDRFATGPHDSRSIFLQSVSGDD